ncbi:hypothetical protein Tco_1050737 [Tanacetum coccineum]
MNQVHPRSAGVMDSYARIHTDILSKGTERLNDLETLLHSDGDALVRMEELKRKASSSNASEIRNPLKLKFSKKRGVNSDALQVQPISNLNLQWNGCSDIEKQAMKLMIRNLGRLELNKFPIKSFWESISKKDNGRTKEASLRDPKLKLIYRLLTNAALHRDYSQDKLFQMDIWLMGLIPKIQVANVPWIINMYLFTRASGTRDTRKIRGGHWVTRIVRNLGLFVTLEIKKCSTPLKSGLVDKKAFAGLID